MAGGRAGVADLRGPRLLNKAVKLSAVDLKAALVREAEALGFDCVGVTDPEGIGNAAKYFREFLDAGAHGDMDWLAAQPERRMVRAARSPPMRRATTITTSSRSG